MTVSALRWGARHRQSLDALLALVLLAAAQILAAAAGQGLSARLLSAAVVVPLAWRRRAPVTVWAICAGVLAVGASRGISALMMAPAPLIALYTVAAHRERKVSVTTGLLSLGCLVAGAAAGVFRFVGVFGAAAGHGPHGAALAGRATLLLPAIVIIAVWLIGDNVRVSRAYLAELQLGRAQAEASRAAELARAAAEERARIARELHDAVVHHVSVIAVQAGAARMLSGNGAPPADTARMWPAVETAARQALTELRQLLGLLRNDGDPPARSPRPGLGQLSLLLDEARGSGLPVQAQIEGSPVPLGAATDLSAYRIVQEALTNVIKHQGSADTTVSVRYQPRQLEIEVISRPGPGQPAAPAALPSGNGHGLIGMRERAAMLGGSLDAGPRPGGGFAVIAQLPLENPPVPLGGPPA